VATDELHMLSGPFLIETGEGILDDSKSLVESILLESSKLEKKLDFQGLRFGYLPLLPILEGQWKQYLIYPLNY
jgi:hypothetical protein